MADTTVAIASQSDWETGDMTECNALDPAGKLTLGVSSDTVAAHVADGALAVFVRSREGSGTTLENVGLGADGALSNADAWRTRDDGRHYLYGRSATVAYHASMAIADDDAHKYGQAAGILVNFASFSSLVIMARANRFSLGISAGGVPYVSYLNKSSGWTTATSPDALVVGTWHELAFVGTNGSLVLYVDGERKASVTGFYAHEDSGSGGLTVTMTGGSWSTFYLFGDATDGRSMLRGASGGYWEKVVSLGARQTLRKVIVDSAVAEEHSGTIQFAFADAEADLDFVPVLSFTLEDQAGWTYWPPERGLKAGLYVKIRINLTAKSWDRSVPIVDYFTATFRDCVAATYDYDGYLEAAYPEVLPLLEEPGPEDLAGAIRELLRQREAIVELKRQVADSFGGGGDYGGYNDMARKAGLFVDLPIWKHQGVYYVGYQAEFASAEDMGEFLYGEIEGHNVRLAEIDGIMYFLAAKVTNLEEGLASAVGDLTAHALAVTGIHGVGAYDVESTAHAAVTLNVHGVANMADLVTGFTVTGMIGDHSDLIEGVHGSGAYKLMAEDDVDTAIGEHSALDYGVHGCVNLVSDFEDDVQPEIEAQITSHEGESDPHTGYCKESDGYATDAELSAAISAHAGAADPHTGYCLESAGYATDAELSAAISVHDGSVAAHALQGWVDSAAVSAAVTDALEDHCNDVGYLGCNNFDEFF